MLGDRGGRKRPEAIPTEPCRVVGCKKEPTHRKPYCLDHITNLPYAQEVQATWARMRNKVCPELIQELKNLPEAKSVARTAVYTGIDKDLIEKAAKHAGLLLTLGSRRGTPRKLVDPERAAS